MAKISINLLPPEIIAEQLKKAKFYQIQFAGVALILIMVFLASISVALRILQSQNIVEVQAKLDHSQQRISNLKTTQSSLFVIKDRLTVIDKYLGVPSKQSAMYQLIDKLVAPPVMISSITVSKEGDVVLLLSVPDSISLDQLLRGLTSSETNENKIDQVSIDSLNRGRDGLYRLSLKIKAK